MYGPGQALEQLDLHMTGIGATSADPRESPPHKYVQKYMQASLLFARTLGLSLDL